MEEQMDTKQQVTRKFIIGMVLIVSALVIGKLVLIPLFFIPGSNGMKLTMLIIYVTSWIMLLVGIALAGWEGYRLVTHKYREYKRKTMDHVKNGSRKAAEHTKKAAIKTKDAAKKTKAKARENVDNFKKDVLEADDSCQEVSHSKKFMCSKP